MPQKIEVVRLTEDVLHVLQASRVDGTMLFLPEGLLDRKLYVKVNDALELLGGKWNRYKKAHVFSDDPAAAIEDAISSGTIADHVKTFQFFETPDAIADRLVMAADPRPGDRVLEPSAGRGAILRAIRRASENGAAPLSIFFCEMFTTNQAALRKEWGEPLEEDFFALDPREKFDCIIANPPFSRRQDMEHVREMGNHLLPGGRVAAIMSPGWAFRVDKQTVVFKNWLRDEMESYCWGILPAGSFRESGTDVNAGILTFSARR